MKKKNPHSANLETKTCTKQGDWYMWQRTLKFFFEVR